MTTLWYGNINDERAAEGLLEAEMCDEADESSCTQSRGLVQETHPLEQSCVMARLYAKLSTICCYERLNRDSSIHI